MVTARRKRHLVATVVTVWRTDGSIIDSFEVDPRGRCSVRNKLKLMRQIFTAPHRVTRHGVFELVEA